MPPPVPPVPDSSPEFESAPSSIGDEMPLPAGPAGSTRAAGEKVDDGKGRIFPCDSCGADLEFAIGCQRLKCPYCGFEKSLEFATDEKVVEQDFEAMLVKLEEWRKQGVSAQQETSEVRCESCGGQVVFTGTLTSSECPYCASPIQRERIHNSETRIPVDGVIPFRVDYERASQQLREWVKARWFAPNEFKKKGIEGKFQGVYEPYWTFDFATFTRFSGERGDHYWVTVGTGKEQRRVRQTRWSSRSGDFQRFFDDILCFASIGLPTWMTQSLEPWPLDACQPFSPHFLAGFLARTYDIPLAVGLKDAQSRASAALLQDIRERIGGDEQRVNQQQTQFNGITYKHLLLPLWLLVYRYQGKVYRVAINGSTGEVQGERPYSTWKIAFAILFCLLILGVIALASQR